MTRTYPTAGQRARRYPVSAAPLRTGAVFAFFSVTIDSTNQPAEGGTLNVDVTVENTGSDQETQTITLDVDASQRDSQDVTLSGGGSSSITLSWTTSSGDADAYIATVDSVDDTAEKAVCIEGGGVSAGDYNPPPNDEVDFNGG